MNHGDGVLVFLSDGQAEVRLETTAAGRNSLDAALKEMGEDLTPVQAGPPKGSATE